MIVRAKLNWGRWICDCPTDNCDNAEYAIWNEVKRKEMICAVCGQGPWSIVLPKNKIITKEKNGINYPKYLKNLPKWR